MTTITVGGYADPLVGYVNSLPWNRAETNIDLVNNWTKIRSNHTIKFGVDIRRLRDELLQTQDAGGPRGQFTYGNNQTSTSGAAVVLVEQHVHLALEVADHGPGIGADERDKDRRSALNLLDIARDKKIAEATGGRGSSRQESAAT